MIDLERYYYYEWHIAEKEGYKKYAEDCKEIYRQLVLERRIKPYHWFKEELKQFETIILN